MIRLKTSLALIFTFLLTHSHPGYAINDLMLPDLGNSSDKYLTTKEQNAIAEYYLRELRKAGLLLEDPLAEEYIQNLGFKLVSHSENPRLNFQFHIIKSPVVNAFATPGGFIAVYSGLIETAESESEIAAVIAHEIAHVTQNHILRSSEETMKANLPIMLGMIAIMIAGAGHGDTALASMAAGQGLLAQNRINFTRDNEYEADRIGIKTLHAAGFNAKAMAGFFGKMLRLERNAGNNDSRRTHSELLRTHPANTNRIAEAKGRAATIGNNAHQDSLNFSLSKERIRVLSSNTPEELRDDYLARLKSSQTFRPELEYGLALLELKLNQTEIASHRIEHLLVFAPNNRFFLLIQARNFFVKKQTLLAIKAYEKLLISYPRDLAILQEYIEALLQSKEPDHWELARMHIQSTLAQHPNLPRLHLFQARSENLLGDQNNATMSDAQATFLSGNIYEAIQKLKHLKNKHTLSYYQLSKIQARLNEYQQSDPKLLERQRQEDRP